jgi:hypothetical protein
LCLHFDINMPEEVQTSLIDLIEKRLKKAPFDEIQIIAYGLSDKPTKKVSVSYSDPETDKVKTVHFGSKNSLSFLEGATKEKRDSYNKRHSKIMLKDGTHAIDRKFSSAWWAYWLLWN